MSRSAANSVFFGVDFAELRIVLCVSIHDAVKQLASITRDAANRHFAAFSESRSGELHVSGLQLLDRQVPRCVERGGDAAGTCLTVNSGAFRAAVADLRAVRRPHGRSARRGVADYRIRNLAHVPSSQIGYRHAVVSKARRQRGPSPPADRHSAESATRMMTPGQLVHAELRSPAPAWCYFTSPRGS